MKTAVFRVSGLLSIALFGAPASQALSFNFTFDAGIHSSIVTGVNAAANLFSSRYNDNITVNIKISYASLSSTILALAMPSFQGVGYSAFRTALDADKLSADDIQAVSSLQAGPSFDYWTNRFGNNPNGAGSMTPYKTSASSIMLTYANAKAIGLRGAHDTAIDATITFNSMVSWDTDRSDGILSTHFDFIGVAAHEIGHALGFYSGVDWLDSLSNADANSITDSSLIWVTPLDLFRYRESFSEPFLAAGQDEKYFSIDNGLTGAARQFATGVHFGDGRQASHWSDDLGLGLMDPTWGPGQFLPFTNLDYLAFDVIGYNGAVVPGPAAAFTMLIGIATLARRRRK